MTKPLGEVPGAGSRLSNGGEAGVDAVVIWIPENPMIPPSTYIVLKMLLPIKNALPLAVSMIRLPWMKLPTDGGRATCDRGVREGVEVEREDVGSGAGSLGRLVEQTEVSTDREDGSVRELERAADVQAG